MPDKSELGTEDMPEPENFSSDNEEHHMDAALNQVHERRGATTDRNRAILTEYNSEQARVDEDDDLARGDIN